MPGHTSLAAMESDDDFVLELLTCHRSAPGQAVWNIPVYTFPREQPKGLQNHFHFWECSASNCASRHLWDHLHGRTTSRHSPTVEVQNEPEKIPLSPMSTLAKKIFDKYLWWWGTYLKRFETYPVQLKSFPWSIAIHLCHSNYHQMVQLLAVCWIMQHVFFKTSRGGTPHSHLSLGLRTALIFGGWIPLTATGIASIDSKRWS